MVSCVVVFVFLYSNVASNTEIIFPFSLLISPESVPQQQQQQVSQTNHSVAVRSFARFIVSLPNVALWVDL